MTQTYSVAWWNVENLFDEENSPRRTDKVARTVGKSIVGWTSALRDRKIDQLSSIIAQLNDGAGPDLMGLAEVENEFVVDQLAAAVNSRVAGRKYKVAHADTSDHRGIDVAFLYDPKRLEAPKDERFQHVVMRRTATREIFQVNFHTKSGRVWTVFGNHWPSRSGGQMESAGYRAIAGETLAYFHERAMDVLGPTTPALAMGDFNDEPFDPSLVRHALSTRQQAKVMRADTPRFLNLMWTTEGVGDGTFYFDNFANVLDQFLVNRNMIAASAPLRVVDGSAQVVRFPEMVRSGAYPAPIPFGGMGKPVNTDGFSDHLPIAVTVEEKD